MKKLFLLVLLCFCSNVNADFNTGDTFGKGIVIQANGVTQTGGGRTLNFSSGTTVTNNGNVYNITSSGTGPGAYWTESGTNLYSPITDTVTTGASTTSRNVFTVNADGALGSGATINYTSVSVEGTGGTITRVGGNTIHTFTSGGTFTPGSSGNVTYLVIGGGGSGGAGGAGGGGGAGGFRTGTLAVTASTPYAITIGAGGIVSIGGDSIFSTITSTGGGKGSAEGGSASNGGSGGGGSYNGTAAGTGVVGQGTDGGLGGGSFAGGGGGGATSAGSNRSGNNGGNGGSGTASSISGASVTYACGGGGASNNTVGSGGCASAGNGAKAITSPGGNGTANTGSGGGGGYDAQAAGNGGSGIVIISYPTPVNSPELVFKAAGTQTAKIWTDGANSDQLTFTVGSTNYMTLTNAGVLALPAMTTNAPMCTSGSVGTVGSCATTGTGSSVSATSPTFLTSVLFGTGPSRGSIAWDGTNTVFQSAGGNNLLFKGPGTATAVTTGSIGLSNISTFATNTSGDDVFVGLNHTINSSSSGGNTTLGLFRTETGLGSGAQYFINAKVGATSKFNVDNTGSVTSTGGNITATSTVGANGVTNGNFDTDLTGWSGANWAWNAGGGDGYALHTAGSTTALTSTFTAVSGQSYKVTFTVRNMTTGTVVPGLGTSASIVSANGTYTEYFVANSASALTFTPTSTFDGGIDTVLVQTLTNGTMTANNGFTMTGGQMILPAGTGTRPSLVLGDDPTYGLVRVNGNASIGIMAGSGTLSAQFSPTGVTIAGLGIQNSTNVRAGGLAMTTGSIAWGPSTTMDVNLSRTATNTITVGTGADGSTGGTLISNIIGIGTSNVLGTGKLSIFGNIGIINEDTVTSSAVKNSRYGMESYDTSKNPFLFFTGRVDGTDNIITVGGGTSLGVASTIINFNTAANNNTASGTLTALIDSSGFKESSGHIRSASGTPRVSSCGGSPSITGSDNSFTVTVGSATTSCTVGFNTTWSASPHCTATEQTQSLVNAFSYTEGAGGMVFSQTALSGSLIDVNCGGN